MTNPPSNTASNVASLMAERARFESWIAALEARRDSTPPHIYQRVHGDYALRLQKVVEQLMSHMSEIEAAAKTLAERLGELDRAESKYRDERSEAELRATVGELSPEAFDEILRRTDEATASIALERSQASVELTRLREVLALNTPKTGATPREGMTREARTPAAPAKPTPSRPETGGVGFDELEFLKSVVDSRGRPVNPTPSAGQPRESDTNPFGLGMPAEPSPSPHVPRQSTQVPAFLKDVPSEQVKTLKCQECGTMNYPTEWYCERCGAELAAL
ncbi:MAG TPA: Ran-binding zinc finger domain-containing protein [Gemmatimonadaceae bacterium]|nr:Ran-binding zinc finger domain-containing protein [Gemmatimonadaceae bacterium]